MDKNTYIENLSKRRERINYMHQIIRKVKEDQICNPLQLDVLLRGYIVLIYSLWESAFKDLHLFFYDSFKEKKVKELPHKIKNKILCNKLEKAQNKKIKTYHCFEVLKKEYIDLLETKVKDINTIYFNYLTNNPDLNMLDDFLSFYAFKVLVEEDIKEKIKYIILSRNDIAHSGKQINNFKDDIKNNFSYEEEIDFLQEVTLEIFNIFNNIINKFEEKYLGTT